MTTAAILAAISAALKLIQQLTGKAVAPKPGKIIPRIED